MAQPSFLDQMWKISSSICKYRMFSKMSLPLELLFLSYWIPRICCVQLWSREKSVQLKTEWFHYFIFFVSSSEWEMQTSIVLKGLTASLAQLFLCHWSSLDVDQVWPWSRKWCFSILGTSAKSGVPVIANQLLESIQMCTLSVRCIFPRALKVLFQCQIYHNPGTPKSNYMGKLKEIEHRWPRPQSTVSSYS